MRVIIGLAILILGSTGGEIAITHGMKSVGEPARLRPRAVLQFLARAVRNGWFCCPGHRSAWSFPRPRSAMSLGRLARSLFWVRT